MNNTEIIRDRNKPPRLHVKPWDETVCSVIPLNTNRSMSLEPYQTADGYEYNWILTKKPERNVVQMAIETEGLDFFHQPRLTAQEIFEGCRRPENVEGSYAVYHKTMAGDYTQLGGKNYQAGKAFHIYRPRPTDAKGRWCWGNLHIDSDKKILSVVIPKWFLERATYPVFHVAGLEFGYHTQGGSSGGPINTNFTVHMANTLPASNGDLTAVGIYCNSGDSAQFCPGLYSDLAAVPSAKLASANSGTVITGLGWFTSPLVYSGIVAGTQYWLAAHGAVGTDLHVYYDTGTGSPPIVFYRNYGGSWPDPYVISANYGNALASIYGVYTAAVTNTGNFFAIL